MPYSWFPMDMQTHTYHIALVQIYLFIFFFSGYYTVPKINYINAMKSINQICTHFSRKQRKKTHAYRLFFGAFLERLGRPPLLVTSPIGKCSAGRPFFFILVGVVVVSSVTAIFVRCLKHPIQNRDFRQPYCILLNFHLLP